MQEKPLITVIDTNVLVSAILKNRLPEKIISYILGSNRFRWVASEEIVSEYKSVLVRPKFALPDVEIEKQFRLIDRKVTLIVSSEKLFFQRDLKDAKFLSCAKASDADYLITGDRDFDGVSILPHTKIISVSRFAKEIGIN